MNMKEDLEVIYKRHNPNNFFKPGDIIRYYRPERSIFLKFPKQYRETTSEHLDKLYVVCSTSYDTTFRSFGEEHIEQDLILKDYYTNEIIDVPLSSSSFFEKSRKQKIQNLLQVI